MRLPLSRVPVFQQFCERNSHPPLTVVSPGRPTLHCMKVQLSKRSTVRARLQLGAVLALVLGMLAMPALASAQSPSDDQYSVVPPSTTTSDPGDPGGTGLSGRVGSLPFTGFDVIAMSAVALAIAGLGLGLQRAVSSRPQE